MNKKTKPITLPLIDLQLPKEIQNVYLSYDKENKINNKPINSNALHKKEIKRKIKI